VSADALSAVITIGIDPMIHLGPVTLAWHGLTIAIGILIGGLLARAEMRARGLDPEPLQTIALILIVGAVVGSRAFYLVERGQLGDPGAWISDRGFTFYGGFIVVALGLVAYIRSRGLSVEYLDASALGLTLGYGIGRIGDLINGEHYGPETTFFLGVRNTHPDADVPRHDVAYHSGGLYEMLIGFIAFAIAMSLRERLRKRPTAMIWLVIALIALGRFVEFFARSDSATEALGLETAQWTSVALIVLAAGGAWITSRRSRHRTG
jgi:phosphatidylglycerol:prolipoprotein diacylglycerol transferase